MFVRKEDMPPYNSLFAGMWWDKTTHIIDSCNCGLTFLLHPEQFLVIYEEPKEYCQTANEIVRKELGRYNIQNQICLFQVMATFRSIDLAATDPIQSGL